MERAMASTEVLAYDRHLLSLLAVVLLLQVAISVVMSFVLYRKVKNCMGGLAERFESLREQSLARYVRTQQEENARLVADTRGSIAQMHALTDAVMVQLYGNTSQIPRVSEHS